MHGKCCVPFCMLLLPYCATECIKIGTYICFSIKQSMAYLCPLAGSESHLIFICGDFHRHLKGAPSTQKLLYYMPPPPAFLLVPNKYPSKAFRLLSEFKFHSENSRKRCSLSSTSINEINKKGIWACLYCASLSCLKYIFYWSPGCILPSALPLPLPMLSLQNRHDFLLQRSMKRKLRIPVGTTMPDPAFPHLKRDNVISSSASRILIYLFFIYLQLFSKGLRGTYVKFCCFIVMDSQSQFRDQGKR